MHERHDLSYFILLAGIVSGYLVIVLLVWMLIVGALLRASGARGFPDALGKIALVTIATGAIAIASVTILGERGTFVCPPWPLVADQVPDGYCAELVDRGLVAPFEPFQMRCREVPEGVLGSHLSNDAPYARDQTIETRSILGVTPSTAIAMRITWHSWPESTERRRAECGEWNLAPSALLSRDEVRVLAHGIDSRATEPT
jgi:hypothetical protein